MVEEKARSLLPRHHFSNLSYYIAEYGARAMNIEAFVSVLLEMLDTPEKVSHHCNLSSFISLKEGFSNGGSRLILPFR